MCVLLILNVEQGGHLVLFQFCADDTQTARHFGAAAADVVLKRHVIEMNPSAVNGGNNALGPKNGAVAAASSAVRAASISSSVNLRGVSAPQEVNTSSAWW